MMVTGRPRGAKRLAIRAGLSLVVLAALWYWMAWSAFLLVIRCGDTCNDDTAADAAEADRWQYTGQFVLSAPAAVVVMIGLGIGFTRYQGASRLLLTLGAAGAIAWLVWVFGIGGF